MLSCCLNMKWFRRSVDSLKLRQSRAYPFPVANVIISDSSKSLVKDYNEAGARSLSGTTILLLERYDLVR